MPITAPYNFVPLSKFVYFPDWADQVSHDIPFEDGISGEIVCELTTQTPVYVRNGGNWERNDIVTNPQAQSFFNVNGQYMIPGTSLKGMLRSVIEIATFGKMCRVDDHRYSVRDLNNKELYQKRFVSAADRVWTPRSQAAWLERDPGGDNWRLVPCSFARVEQHTLRAYHPGPVRPDLRECSSAVDKYRAWGDCPRTVDFTSTGLMNQIGRHPGKPLNYDLVTALMPGCRGTIVFTGQPAPNKHMEFIFFGNSGTIAVDDKIRENFKFVHSLNGDTDNPNTEWAYWKERLLKGDRVPVFYLLDKNGNLESFGLAQMYKLPYTYGIHKTIENRGVEHLSESPDFAEVLFGSVADKGRGKSFKGRVSVSHALWVAGEGACGVKETVLGAPKPTYYPNYLEQPLVKNAQQPANQRTYKTYMDADAEARGWKRYPARLPGAVVDPLPAPLSTNVATRFNPLRPGASFSFSVKFHNLRPAEIGALLWALEWGGDNRLCHSLGMGKPFGYGLVKIAVDAARSNLRPVMTGDMASSLKAFQDSMQAFCREKGICTEWAKSEQLFHLTSMANPQRNGETEQSQRQRLRNMLIDNPTISEKKKRNEFQVAKDPNNPQWLQTVETYLPPPPPPAFGVEEEVWPAATLNWAKGNSELQIVDGAKKAFIKLSSESERKQFIPAELYSLVVERMKTGKAKVTVAREGRSIKVIKIELPTS